MAVTGTYHDGRSSRALAVQVSREGALVRIEGDGLERRVALADVHVDAPLGRTRRTLRLADGAQVQIDDSDGLDRLLPARDRVDAGAAWLERRWSVALG